MHWFLNMFRSTDDVFKDKLNAAKIVELQSGEFVISSYGNYWGIFVTDGVTIDTYYKSRAEAEVALSEIWANANLKKLRSMEKRS